MIIEALTSRLVFGVVSIITLAALAIFIRKTRRNRAVESFTMFLGSLVLWAAADVLELIGPTATWCQFWFGTFRTLAVCSAAVTWIHFVQRFVWPSRGRWQRYSLMVVMLIAGGFAAIALTPMRTDWLATAEFERAGWLFHPIGRDRTGLLFPAYFASLLSIGVLGLATLAIFGYRSALMSRRQVFMLLLAFSIQTAVSAASTAGLLGNPVLDKSVFVFPATAAIVAFAVFSHGLMRTSPMILSSLMDAIPDVILAFDADKQVTEANAAAKKIVRRFSLEECKSERILNKDITEHFPNDCKFGNEIRHLEPGEKTVMLNDHRGRVTLRTSVRGITKGGAPDGFILVGRDVTKNQQLLEDLEAYSHRVAHDLKSPLQAILTYNQMLAAEQISVSEATTVTQKAVDSMNGIIHELLLLGKIDDGDESLLEEVDIYQSVKDLVERFEVMYPHVAIEVTEPEGWKKVMARAAWVEEILSNLVANAVEHGNQEDARIRIACEVSADSVEVSVSDNGEGLKDLPKAQPIHRLDSEQSHMPRGFGLSITRRLVEKQGGSFGYRESEWSGTTFWFCLRPAKK